MAYFIKQIEHNKYNHYKYHYLDHMTTVIDIRDNYWSFDIDLYSINDFSLPLNSLAGDLQIPYQQVHDIVFNLNSDQSTAQSLVEYNKEYARLYSGHFDIDVSQNEFLKQDLNNIKLVMELSLFIDPEAAKGAGSDIKQEDLDPLMNETSEQRWSFEMYYSNTHLINQEGYVDNITGYKLPFGHVCIPTNRKINFNCNQYVDLTTGFNDLVNISSSTQFQVLSAKVKFYYWLESDVESKTLEKTLNIDRSISDKSLISINDFTLFDYDKNNVLFDPKGSLGFNIPVYSQGYYEVELLIQQDNAINKFIVKNNFNFIENAIEPFIAVTNRTINDLTGFKEVRFDD